MNRFSRMITVVTAVAAITLGLSSGTASAAITIDPHEFDTDTPAQLTTTYEVGIVNQMLTDANLKPVQWTNVLSADDIYPALQADKDANRITQIVNTDWVAGLKSSSLFAPAFNLGILARVYHGMTASPQETDFESLAAMQQQAIYAGAAVAEFSKLTGLSLENKKDTDAITALLVLGAKQFKDSNKAYAALLGAYNLGFAQGLGIAA